MKTTSIHTSMIPASFDWLSGLEPWQIDLTIKGVPESCVASEEQQKELFVELCRELDKVFEKVVRPRIV